MSGACHAHVLAKGRGHQIQTTEMDLGKRSCRLLGLRQPLSGAMKKTSSS
jgi:hypothetical protein